MVKYYVIRVTDETFSETFLESEDSVVGYWEISSRDAEKTEEII